MNLFWVITGLLFLLFLSGAFSGSETGVYSVSRARIDGEAAKGRRRSKLLRGLLRDDTQLLITLLVGNNLMLELLTHGFDRGVAAGRVPAGTRELFVTLLLTPIVFLLGELMPKDLFRRHPHLFLGWATPLISVARALFFPVVWPLSRLSRVLERALGLAPEDVARALAREEMLEILAEGMRAGALAPQAERLARNVLVLRETPVERVMIPWERVRTVDLDAPADELQGVVRDSDFTRLPALRRSPGASAGASAGSSDGPGRSRVIGYVHQLEALGAPEEPLEEALHGLEAFAPELPVDTALARLRTQGRRMALVGDPEAPVGLVSLMDLVAAISGEPAA